MLLTADAFGVLPPVSILERRGGDVSLRDGVHLEARGHRGGRDRARGRRSRPVSAPPSCRTRRRCMPSCSPGGWGRVGPGASCSTRGGVAAPTARASGCRSRRPAPCSTRRSTGEFDDVELEVQPILGLKMPVTCAGVDDAILNPPRHVGRPRGLRRGRGEAARHVPGQLRQAGVRRCSASSGP